MVIDGHCHAGLGDGLTGPWDTEAPLGAYLRRARRAGIGRTVILPPFHSDYAIANAAVGALVGRHPDRFIGFCCVHPKRDRGRIADLVGQAVRRWGFRGIKVHAIDGAATREVCDTARRFGLPVLYDVGGRTNLVEMAASQYPDVGFIVPHLGSFLDDVGAHLQVIDQMTRLANVHADTSGVRRFDYLQQAVRRAGPRKLVFGSDGPWLHPGVELQKVRLLGLAEHSERLVTGGNLLRLIGGAGRAAALAG